MGLGRLLTRSAGPRAVRRRAGLVQPPRVLPQSVTERTALAVPAFWRGHALICGGLGGLPVVGVAGHRGARAAAAGPAPTGPHPDADGVLDRRHLRSHPLRQQRHHHRRHRPARLSDRPQTGPPAARRRPSDRQPGRTGHRRLVSGRPVLRRRPGVARQKLRASHRPADRGRPARRGDGRNLGGAGVAGLPDQLFCVGGDPVGDHQGRPPRGRLKEAARLKSEWVQKFSGTQEPAVLNSLTEFQPVAFKPVDSARCSSAAELSVTRDRPACGGCPPSQLGAEAGSGTYRNVESDQQQTREAIAPWAAPAGASDRHRPAAARSERPNGSSTPTCGPTPSTRFRAYAEALAGSRGCCPTRSGPWRATTRSSTPSATT